MREDVEKTFIVDKCHFSLDCFKTAIPGLFTVFIFHVFQHIVNKCWIKAVDDWIRKRSGPQTNAQRLNWIQ